MGSNGPDDKPIPTSASRYDLGPIPGNVPPNVDPLAAKFEELFPGRRKPAEPVRGDDLRCDVVLTFEEAVLGAEKTIRFSRWEPCNDCGSSGARPGTKVEICPRCQGAGATYTHRDMVVGSFIEARNCKKCSGSGKIIAETCPTCRAAGRVQRIRERSIHVPIGVASGMRMPLYGEGDVGERGGAAGDAYVFFEVTAHPVFRREGNDLYCQVTISERQAADGAVVQAPLIQGYEELRVSEGTQSGHQLTLRGQGVPDVHGRGKGDLHVTLQVTPDGAPISKKEERKSKGLFDRLFGR